LVIWMNTPAVAALTEFKVAFALRCGRSAPRWRLEPSRRRRAGHLFVVSASGQLGNKCLKLFWGHS